MKSPTNFVLLFYTLKVVKLNYSLYVVNTKYSSKVVFVIYILYAVKIDKGEADGLSDSHFAANTPDLGRVS